MIRTLIVEDSSVELELLVHLLRSDPGIEVIGVATDGEKALEAVQRLKPDVITMDIHMPRMNGYETTRRIMESHPVPIVIVSGSFVANDMEKTFHAVEAGALAIVRKPCGPGHPGFATDAEELIRTVKTMSEVRVVRRWPKRTTTAVSAPQVLAVPAPKQTINVVAIGASTGGPTALQELFCALPGSFSVPIMAVQHMTRGFMEGFTRWLAQSSGLPVHVASAGELLLPGHIYFAPEDKHMLVGKDFRIHLSDASPENGLRPAVSVLFRSVAEAFGANAAAVLLTGMGRDGAQELKQLHQCGAVTLIQDRETSVVYGMPGEALLLGAADHVLPPAKIAAALAHLVTER